MKPRIRIYRWPWVEVAWPTRVERGELGAHQKRSFEFDPASTTPWQAICHLVKYKDFIFEGLQVPIVSFKLMRPDGSTVA